MAKLVRIAVLLAAAGLVLASAVQPSHALLGCNLISQKCVVYLGCSPCTADVLTYDCNGDRIVVYNGCCICT